MNKLAAGYTRRPSYLWFDRIFVLTGMRGRIGGDIAALGAHPGRQLIFGASAIGAATNGRASGRSSFRRRSAKVGPKPSKSWFPSHRAATA